MTAPALRLDRAHVTPRRLRLRARGGLDRAALPGLLDRLAAVDGVEAVVARPNTGSVILTIRDSAEAIENRIATLGIARIGAPPAPPPVSQVMQFGMLRLDSDIRRHSDGALDLRSALAVLLSVGAVMQLTRGRVAGPATTLAMTAFSLLEPGKGGGKG